MIEFNGKGYTILALKNLHTVLANAWMATTTQCDNNCKKCNNYLPCKDINDIMESIESLLHPVR